MTLRDQLLELCEPKYMKFTSALMPGVENVLGIRLPLLRKIAREIAAGDWRAYLAQAGDFYFEERMLQGMVISYARCDPAEKLEHVTRFIPKIDNWAVCDCFCWRLKAAERQPMWEFIRPRFRSEAEYEVRFAVVMALGNFVDQAHIEDLLQLLDGIRHEAYYARMGVAWAVSVCYIKFPERTHAWLESCSLDDWTFNKSLQKIVESYRVSDAAKQEIRAMKRRK
ncbi:DNA alkylation repair protein [Alistipes sp.]|uniref:DNA alkylation repair protein n=1 Tax=Alistipes sp. TaxID=1872444 RepID=UPI003AB415A0